MVRHRERRQVPWNAADLCDLVADVERYPEFLPWCAAARILRREGDVFWADLVIGFRLIRERYVSEVTVVPGREIHAACRTGPFRSMQSRWRFVPLEDGGCRVEFDISFEFRSRVLERTLGVLYHEAVRRLMTSFESRARELYGSGARHVSASASASPTEASLTAGRPTSP